MFCVCIYSTTSSQTCVLEANDTIIESEHSKSDGGNDVDGGGGGAGGDGDEKWCEHNKTVAQNR